MLEQKDFEQIAVLVTKIVNQALEDFVPRVEQIVTEKIGQALEEVVLPQFQDIRERLDRLEARVTRLEESVARLEARVTRLEGRMDHMEAQMVTKDYLDDKLADLRSDLMTVDRKQEAKLNAMALRLKERDVFDEPDLDALKKFDAFQRN